ncbi:hypothetical protein DPEC_G00069830 [Dallia pectoralis]|uniref:Uncharacterized protein n=1 Tax=Dallia pectoralis TaxID=75939 RepID=A0ACC2H368_DALPE|nr:hypothetical protein DPEC_G00069830 [Dallia pectoralis]
MQSNEQQPQEVLAAVHEPQNMIEQEEWIQPTVLTDTAQPVRDQEEPREQVPQPIERRELGTGDWPSSGASTPPVTRWPPYCTPRQPSYSPERRSSRVTYAQQYSSPNKHWERYYDS